MRHLEDFQVIQDDLLVFYNNNNNNESEDKINKSLKTKREFVCCDDFNI